MRASLACASFLLALLVPSALSGASTGWLDRQFGRKGIVRTTFVGNDRPGAVAVQADGKIVVAATAFASTSQWDFAVARYRPDGSLDRSFGAGGKVLVDVGPQTPDHANSIAIQPDGRIVVAGWSGRPSKIFESNLALVRLTSAGRLDPTFGQGGKVVTDVGLGGTINALALQSDGRLVVAGSRTSQDRFDASDILLARYTRDGSLDPTFDGDGWQVTDLRLIGNEFARAVAVQGDGTIVVGGGGGHVGEPGVSISDSAIARYRPDGALDISFGDSGQVLVDLSTTDWVAELLVQPGGRIVAAATAGDWLDSRPSRFALFKLRADGALDRGFGQGGKVLTGFTRDPRDRASSLVRGPGGTLVVAGGHMVRSERQQHSNFALARYRPDGRLDPTFGQAGLLQTDLGGDEEILDLVRQRNGRLVALGSYVRNEAYWGVTVARYLSRPSCVVPEVRRLSLMLARSALTRAGCRVGRITHRGSRGRSGVVLAQRPGAGVELPRGGRVNLVVTRDGS